jgi:YD repeat-containing protein
MKRLIMMLLASAVLLGSLASDASAQCTGSATFVFPPFKAGFFACIPPPLFVFTGYTCSYKANCPPAALEGHSFCPHGSEPICFSDGDTYIEQTDIRIPGLSGGLTLTRTWNSLWPSTQMISQVGLFGPNWRSTYEERVFVGSDNYIKYARSDGAFWSFGYGTAGVLVPAAPANVSATLVQGSTNWTLTFQNGEQRLFDINSGSLTAIVDRNGNTTQLTYDGTNRLVTVTDPASRHLTFTYANNTSRLVTGVSSDVGNLSLTYSYDPQNRLSRVTKPDLTTLTLQYDTNSRLLVVLDSNSKVLEMHGYDSQGRGLFGQKAGGVEYVYLTYGNQ